MRYKCSIWTSSLTAHQSAMHVDKIHLLTLPCAFFLSFVFDSLSCLVISLSVFLVIRPIFQGLRDTLGNRSSTRGVSFVLYHTSRWSSAAMFLWVLPFVHHFLCRTTLPCDKDWGLMSLQLWGEEKRREHMLTRLSVQWLQSAYTESERQSRSSEVIICKKWITLTLYCWAQWRAETSYAWKAPSRTPQHTSKLSSCRLLDTFISQDCHNGVIREHKHGKSIKLTLGLSKLVVFRSIP